MKPDAQALFDRIRQAGQGGETPRKIGEDLGIHPKRVARLCEKWERQGLYDWGVTVDLGWRTDYLKTGVGADQ